MPVHCTTTVYISIWNILNSNLQCRFIYPIPNEFLSIFNSEALKNPSFSIYLQAVLITQFWVCLNQLVHIAYSSLKKTQLAYNLHTRKCIHFKYKLTTLYIDVTTTIIKVESLSMTTKKDSLIPVPSSQSPQTHRK